MEWGSDLYGRMQHGTLNRQRVAAGVEETRRRLRRLALESGHDCYGVRQGLVNQLRDVCNHIALASRESIAVPFPNNFSDHKERRFAAPFCEAGAIRRSWSDGTAKLNEHPRVLFGRQKVPHKSNSIHLYPAR